MDAKHGQESFIRKILMPHMQGAYDDLLTVCRDADFLISGELMFAAPLVAERLGLRWGSMHSLPVAVAFCTRSFGDWTCAPSRQYSGALDSS